MLIITEKLSVYSSYIYSLFLKLADRSVFFLSNLRTFYARYRQNIIQFHDCLLREMSITEEASDEVLVHELLEDICDITIKIKRELDIINNLVKHNGELSLAVAETNETLLKVIENNHIFMEEDENETSSDNNDRKKNKSRVSKNK